MSLPILRRGADTAMRAEYDFSNARRNPYAARLKQPVTIRLDIFTVAYFKMMADEVELPYQSLINLYLRDCAATERKLGMRWKRGGKSAKKLKSKGNGKRQTPR
jgi:hypothetical protein